MLTLEELGATGNKVGRTSSSGLQPLTFRDVLPAFSGSSLPGWQLEHDIFLGVPVMSALLG